MNTKSFASDNHSGIHPLILEAIHTANTGHTPAYGDDPWTLRATELIRSAFEAPHAGVYLAFNGTGANILSLQTATLSFGAVLCADTAHINVDECGAPEKNIGCKLIAIPNINGKLTPETVSAHLHGFGFQHHAQPSVISISQVSELGTIYTPDEIGALATLAHSHGMYLHVDGARIANAVAASGVSLREMLVDSGVDVVSFGGTKNGMMLGEAVVVLNRELDRNFLYKRKQSMQLCSKMRFIAAQFEAYLTDGLWIKLARAANDATCHLYELLKDIDGVAITRPVQANALFAIIPTQVREQLLEQFCFYVWDESTGEVRWMCSFDTTSQDIEHFAAAVRCASTQK